MKKLNLGCGEFRKKGYINLDINKNVKPEVVHDLTKFPYPFKNDYFDLVEADHVLEHTEDPFKVMKELHRIMKRNGTLIVRVPHFSRGFTHADHKRGFDVSFPYYFNPKFWGGYSGVDFQLKNMRLHWFGQMYLKKTLFPKPICYLGAVLGNFIDLFANLNLYFCSRVWCFLVGGFEEIEFHFVKN